MKQLLSRTLLAALTAMAAVPAQATTCLNLREITRSEPNREGTAITFQMRDGKVWRSDLQGICPDAQFEGFSWTVRSPEQICENEQSLRVRNTGQTCVLGKFTQMTPAPRG